MDRLAFTALSAVNEQRIARQVLANDLANVATVGFKRSYESAMVTVKVEGPGFDSRLMPMIEQRDRVNLSAGPRMSTGMKLDIAMDGETVLGVTAPNGELAFTRRGDLRVNASGALENGERHLVRGRNGPITLPVGFDIDITPDGTIYARDPANPEGAPQRVDQLLLRDASQAWLARRDDGLFKATGNGARPDGDFATGPKPASVSVGMLEGSNVSPVTAMVQLIEQSRSFEAHIRIIRETKDLDESGASMIGLSR